MPKRLTKEEFIQKSKSIHGNRFDYSKVEYTNNHTPVEIICCVLGVFHQSPSEHYVCKNFESYVKHSHKNRNTEWFINAAMKVHGNRYDYFKTNYTNQYKKVKIVCRKHGLFLQTPKSHLNGVNCFKCSGTPKLTKEEFIQKSERCHKNKYDYSSVSYYGNKVKVEIVCPKHGSFWQKPNDHMLNHGCPKCSNNISKPEIEFLDHLKIKDRNVKINGWKKKLADGYDSKTNTIYEFLGDYWHGNPKNHKSNDFNKRTKNTFGFLYNQTIERLNKIKSLGYNVKYIWESDWKDFKHKKVPSLLIKTI